MKTNIKTHKFSSCFWLFFWLFLAFFKKNSHQQPTFPITGTCICKPGYKSVDCSENINDCSSDPCGEGACTDGENEYTCECASYGYHGNNCEFQTNECYSNPCQNSGFCVEKLNEYSCNCKNGLTGVNCEIDVDYCKSVFDHCVNGICVDEGFDNVDKYRCDCATYRVVLPECQGNHQFGKMTSK